MKRSSGRILTTHVGSLPRPDLAGMIFAGAQTGTAEQRAAFEARVASAVKEVVDKQIAAGVDIVSDGEQGEHPEAVAERIKNFAGIVGPERVIASTDCGFGTFIYLTVPEQLAYAKLKTLAEGAALASKDLF